MMILHLPNMNPATNLKLTRRNAAALAPISSLGGRFENLLVKAALPAYDQCISSYKTISKGLWQKTSHPIGLVQNHPIESSMEKM